MLSYILVGAGGAMGSVARFWASGVVTRHFGETFPWGTLIDYQANADVAEAPEI